MTTPLTPKEIETRRALPKNHMTQSVTIPWNDWLWLLDIAQEHAVQSDVSRKDADWYYERWQITRAEKNRLSELLTEIEEIHRRMHDSHPLTTQSALADVIICRWQRR